MSGDSLQLDVGAATSGGRRQTNADAYLIDEAARLFAVSDGIGDSERSVTVARTALEAVREMYAPPWSLLPDDERTLAEAGERMVRGLVSANGRIYEGGATEKPRVGTTFTGVMLCADGNLCIGHMGDSRVYRLYRDSGKLVRLTEDDTVLADALRLGERYSVAAERPNVYNLTRC
jgi:serine/threonine protein phosphatase PrpC